MASSPLLAALPLFRHVHRPQILLPDFYTASPSSRHPLCELGFQTRTSTLIEFFVGHLNKLDVEI